LHPHAFRHLVATLLDEKGLTAREIADYLGHDRVSMTQDVYMTRKAGSGKPAVALDDLAPPD
jgi:integrase